MSKQINDILTWVNILNSGRRSPKNRFVRIKLLSLL